MRRGQFLPGRRCQFVTQLFDRAVEFRVPVQLSSLSSKIRHQFIDQGFQGLPLAVFAECLRFERANLTQPGHQVAHCGCSGGRFHSEPAGIDFGNALRFISSVRGQASVRVMARGTAAAGGRGGRAVQRWASCHEAEFVGLQVPSSAIWPLNQAGQQRPPIFSSSGLASSGSVARPSWLPRLRSRDSSREKGRERHGVGIQATAKRWPGRECGCNCRVLAFGQEQEADSFRPAALPASFQGAPGCLAPGIVAIKSEDQAVGVAAAGCVHGSAWVAVPSAATSEFHAVLRQRDHVHVPSPRRRVRPP